MKTSDQLLAALQELGLLSADAIAEIKRRWQQSGVRPDAVSSAKELVKTGRLTRYQAEEILNGRGAKLAFGAYIVLDKLGQGGMGMVLRGQHREMKRPVAIKMLPKEMLKQSDAAARFRREVEAAARLTHPNIVTAYDSGHVDGTPYLVMELVTGSDLHSFVSDNGPMRVLDAIHCITEVARGLDYAHEQGIVHRDIKPANLLLATGSVSGTTKTAAAAVAALAETAKAPDVLKCRVKVLDMGLARIDEAALAQATHAPAKPGASPLTGTGDIMGTVDYMSPEQAVDTRSADARADVYSLGCTLCYLLTGHPPFSGETMVQRLIAHRTQPIVSLRTERPDVPESLDRLYQKMLAKHPDERIGSMTDVIAALEDCRLEVSPEAQKAAMIRKPANQDQATRMGKAGSIETLRSRKTKTQRDDDDLLDDESVEDDEQKTIVRRRTTRQAPQTVIVQSSGQWIWLTMGIAGMLLIGGMGYAILQLLNREPQDKIVVVEKETKTESDRAEVVQAPLLNSERSIAEWALSNGGRLRIFPQKGEPQDVFDRGGLPATPFRIDVLAVDGASSVTDAEMSSMNRLKSMSEFSAARTGITDAGLKSLVGLSTLKSVNLRGVALTDSGLETIGKIPQLSFLSADGNFTDDGIAQLKQLEQLEHLTLSADVASNSAITTIVAHHPALVTFLTEHFNVTDDGLNPLLNLSELRVLGLADAPLTDASVEILSQMKQLTTLIVQGTKITPDGLRRLQEALPACRIYGGKFDPRRNAVREILEAGGKVTIAAIGQPPFELTNFAQLPDDFSALSINLAGVKTVNLSSMALNDVTDLNLAESGVLSRDIARLSTYFPILTSIDLTSTSVNDTTCLPLQLVESLRFCNMSRTQVTNTAGNKLKQANPDCEFLWGEPPRSPDREVAEWVLKVGGWIEVFDSKEPANQLHRVKRIEEMPTGEIKLWVVHLDGRAVTDDDLKRFVGLRTIQFLSLGVTPVTDAGMESIGTLASLKYIHLFNGPRISDVGLRHLAKLPHLNHLHLEGAAVSSAGLLAFGVRPKFTDQLMLSGKQIDDEALRVVATQFPNLSGLSVRSSSITSAGLKHLRQMPHLRSLWLWENDLSDDAGSAMAELPNLRVISVSRNPRLGDAFLKGLCDLKRIVHLECDSTLVTDRGIRELERLEALGSASFLYTSVSEAGIAPLRKKFPNAQLSEHPQLRFLKWIIANGASAEVEQDSGTIKKVITVEQIPNRPFKVRVADLSGNKSITGFWPYDPSHLREFRIADSNFASDSVSYLAQLSELHTLDARNTALIDIDFAKLANSRSLKHVDITGTAVSIEAARRFRQSRPDIELIGP